MELFKAEPLSRLVRVSPSHTAGPVPQGLLERRDWAHWRELEAHREFQYQADCLKRLKVLSSSTQEGLRSVLESYPLHPAVTFLLPGLAEQLEFDPIEVLTSERPGGLGYFLNNFRVSQPSARLSLYTLDHLYGYLEARLEAQFPELHQALGAAVVQTQDLPHSKKLLRTIALLQAGSHESLPNSSPVILWAAHLDSRQTDTASKILQQMVKRRHLNCRESSQGLFLPFEKSGPSLVEVARLVRRELPEKVDSFELLSSQAPLKTIPFDRFNARQASDRYLQALYLRPEELEKHTVVEAHLTHLVKGERYSGDLLVVYLVASRREELKRLASVLQSSRFDHPRLVLAVPKRPYDLSSEANQVEALERILASHPPFNKPGGPSHRGALTALAEARQRLTRRLAEFTDPSLFSFHYRARVYSTTKEGWPDFLDDTLEKVLGDPPEIGQAEFATILDPPGLRSRRRAALDYLLSCRGPLLLHHMARPRHKTLAGALVKTGLVEAVAQGPTRSTYSPAQRALSPLARLVEQTKSRLARDQTLTPLAELTEHWSSPPLSLPPSSQELLIAFLIWCFQEKLTLLKDGRSQFVDAQAIGEAIASPATYRLSFRLHSPNYQTFLTGLGEHLGLGPQAEESDIARALLQWFGRLPTASLSVGRDKTAEARKLARLLESPGVPAKSLLAVKLPECLGLSLDEPETLLVYFTETQKTLEEAIPRTTREIHAKLRELFAREASDLQRPWPTLIHRWYLELQEPKRAPNHLNALLATYSPASVNEQACLDELLEATGCGPVASWPHNRAQEFLGQIRGLKAELEWAPLASFYPVQDDAGQRLTQWALAQTET